MGHRATPGTHRLEGDVCLEHRLADDDGLPAGWRGGAAAGLRLHSSQQGPCQQQACLSHVEHAASASLEGDLAPAAQHASGLAVHNWLLPAQHLRLAAPVPPRCLKCMAMCQKLSA